MSNMIFNHEKTDYGQNESLFLGQPSGLMDTVHRKHDFIWNRIYKTMKDLDWDEQEFDFSTANVEFKTRPKRLVEVMRNTLFWQWEADSIAARSIIAVMGPFINNAELQAAWTRIVDNECYTEEHEFLTESGWKPIKDAKLGDSVCMLNEDGEPSYGKVKGVIQKSYSGTLYTFENPDQIYQRVTANHRMPLWDENGEFFKFITAHDVVSNYRDLEDFCIGTDTKRIPIRDLTITIERVTDFLVYCITVDTGMFFVRHPGCDTQRERISVGGNCLHSLTYSEIVRWAFDDPSEVMSEMTKVKDVQERMTKVTEVMEQCYKRSHEYALGLVEGDQETYNAAFLFTAALYIMERVQFMASFAVTFAIGRTGAFMPIVKAVQRICQDEFEVHSELDKYILTHEMQNERGRRAIEQLWPTIRVMLEEVIETEIQWNQSLLHDEPLVGLTKHNLDQWVRFCAADVYRTFGRKPEWQIPKENPLPYMEDWIDISKTQSAKKEQKDGNYKANIVREADELEVYPVNF